MNVMAEFHAYYQYLHDDGHYPDNETQLANLWLNTGRISEAQKDGIPVYMGENGVNINKFSTYSEAKQDQSLQNALDICIANGIPYTIQDFTNDKSADEILLSSESPYTWNNAGTITHNAWLRTASTTSTPNSYLRDPILGTLGITTTVIHTLVITTTNGGATSPAAGSYSYNGGASVTVTANAAKGYRFDHWSLDGTNVGSS